MTEPRNDLSHRDLDPVLRLEDGLRDAGLRVDSSLESEAYEGGLFYVLPASYDEAAGDGLLLTVTGASARRRDGWPMALRGRRALLAMQPFGYVLLNWSMVADSAPFGSLEVAEAVVVYQVQSAVRL